MPDLKTKTNEHPPPLMSLRRRLALSLVVILTVGGLMVASAAWGYGRRAARIAYDSLLIGAAQQMAGSVRVSDGALRADIPVSAFQLLSLAPDDRVFYAIVGPDGRVLTGDPLALAPDDSRFWSDQNGAETVRYVREIRHLSEPGLSGDVTVIVGQTTRARDRLASEITRNALILAGLAGLIMAALSAMAARAALRPLSRLESALANRRAHDQSPLDVAVPRELSGFVATLNDQRARVARILNSQRRMIADASHQLRTPIAGLRAQAELAAGETEPDRLRAIAARIHGRAVDLSRLTDQILSRALIIHRADAVPLKPLDLRAVALDAAEQIRNDIPAAGEKLLLDLDEAPLPVLGDALSLAEAAKNLIVNALSHGVAPVTVAALAKGGAAVLAVRDTGTGPAPDTPAHGAGLGLAIADAVARAHGGRLSGTLTPQGWEATITLPLNPTEEET